MNNTGKQFVFYQKLHGENDDPGKAVCFSLGWLNPTNISVEVDEY